MSDLFESGPPPRGGGATGTPPAAAEPLPAFPKVDGNAPVTAYEYRYEDGTLGYVVCRYEQADGGKTFRQWRLNPEPGGRPWLVLGDARRVPYHLPQALAASTEPRSVLYIPEGEKDVEAIEGAGGVATTNPMGALKWDDAYTEQLLAFRTVYVVADKEPANGLEHAQAIIESFGRLGYAGHIEILMALEGKDPYDHLVAHERRLDELVPWVVEVEKPDAVFMDAFEFVKLRIDAPEPLWGSPAVTLIPAGGLVIGAGRPGVGKTTFVLDLACHLAAGMPYPPAEVREDSKRQAPEAFGVPRPLRIAIIENEGPLEMFRDKLARKLEVFPHPIQDVGGFLCVQTWRWGAYSFADEDAFTRTEQELDELRIDLVIGDPLSMLGMEGVGSPAETRAFVQIVRRLGLGVDRAFLFLHHFREKVDRTEDEMARISGAWGGHLDTLFTIAPMGAPDEARLAFPKVRWAREQPPTPRVLGKVYRLAGFECLAEEGDLALLEPLLAEALAEARQQKLGKGERGWMTYTELAQQLPGGRRKADVKKALEQGVPHLFAARTGESAKALGARGNATLYGLATWDDAPSPQQPVEHYHQLGVGDSAAAALDEPERDADYQADTDEDIPF